MSATKTFYSDPHPEVTCIDGAVYRVQGWPDYDDWAGIRNGAGTGSVDYDIDIQVALKTPSVADRWAWIYRGILLFDTSTILTEYDILEISLFIKRHTATNNFTLKPSLGVYASNPASDTALVNADYGSVGSTLLSSVIGYDTFAASEGPHEMVFTQAGLDAINKGGITKLAIRDATRDGPNNEAWESNKACALVFYAAEYGYLDCDPYLTITYVDTTHGDIYPSVSTVRVSSLIHRWVPGSYTLEVVLGGLTSDFGLVVPSGKPTPTIPELPTCRPGEVLAWSVDRGYFCIPEAEAPIELD